jgi:hypothetical protein
MAFQVQFHKPYFEESGALFIKPKKFEIWEHIPGND